MGFLLSGWVGHNGTCTYTGSCWFCTFAHLQVPAQVSKTVVVKHGREEIDMGAKKDFVFDTLYVKSSLVSNGQQVE